MRGVSTGSRAYYRSVRFSVTEIKNRKLEFEIFVLFVNKQVSFRHFNFVSYCMIHTASAEPTKIHRFFRIRNDKDPKPNELATILSDNHFASVIKIQPKKNEDVDEDGSSESGSEEDSD